MPKIKLPQLQPIFMQRASVLIIVLLSLVPIWYNTLKYTYPIGYAGMYAQLAEQIANENLKLPMEIDFYGSGGVPAAFPPLGMYLLALYLKIGGSLWAYIRFIPAILSTLALLGLFLLTRQITASKTMGLITMLLAASSPYLYSTHIWAAGIVRGLAYVFGLFFFYYFIRTTQHGSRKEGFIAGVLLSLTALTHLSYAFFFVVWSLVWVIVNPKKEIWLRSIWIGGISALLTLPWALLIVDRHGWQVFLNALGSHGTLSIFEISGSFTDFFEIVSISPGEIIKQPVLAIMALLGIAYSIRQKRWFLLSATIFTSLFSLESRRFILVLGCIFAAVAIQSITTWLMKFAREDRHFTFTLVSYALGVVIVSAIYVNGLKSIFDQTPSLSPSLLEAGEYIRTNSATESYYLILADHHEAEWFPFLAKRNPLFGFWGGEWSGNRDPLSTGFFSSMACARKADIDCLEKTIQDAENHPQYLVVMKRRYRGFIDILKQQQDWILTYNNSEYQIWKNMP